MVKSGKRPEAPGHDPTTLATPQPGLSHAHPWISARRHAIASAATSLPRGVALVTRLFLFGRQGCSPPARLLLTDGLFTPLIGSLISDAGYDTEYTLKQKKKLERPPTWDEAMDYEYPDLTIKKPTLMDFGAAGKGYLVDLVGEILDENGANDYCIDAGGDILHKGKKPIRIGLENPMDKDQVIGIGIVGNGSICGSSGNRRRWGEFTHIMNPKTLTSPADITAVWVVTDTAILADALATCLFFIPASALVEYKFEYVLIHSDGSFERSPGFQGEIFS